MSIAGGIGAAVRLPTPDARFGVEVQAARSPGRTRFRRGAYASTALTDVATVTRATQSWGVDQGGNVAAVAAGQPVVNTAGLAVYEARTNYVRNPTGLGAVVGTPGTYPTSAGLTWNVANPGGEMQWQIASVGSEYGFNYYDLRIYGTPSVSNQAALPKADVSLPAASVGQTWTYQVGARLISGAGPAQARAFIMESTGENTAPTVTLDNRYRVYSASRTFTNAAVASAEGYLRLDLNSGVAYDFVVRIYWQNLKLGADINDPPILQTNNAAATRNADVITEAVNIPVGQSFTVTGKVIAPASQTYNQFVFVLDDGQSTPTNLLRVTFNAGALLAKLVAGGIETSNISLGTIAAGAPVGIALSVEGSTVAFSVNGVEVVTQTMAGPFAAALTRLCLGHYPGGSNQLNSTLRDLAITMRAYTPAERAAASDVTLTHDLDFTSRVYQYVGAPYVTPTDLPGTTFARTTTGTDRDGGQIVNFAAGVLKITSAGCLFEAQKTNVVRFSEGTTALLGVWGSGGAAPGDGSGAWSQASTTAGMTISTSAKGTYPDGCDWWEFTLSGTPNATQTTGFYFDANPVAAAASSGQTWVSALDMEFISMTGCTGGSIAVFGRKADGSGNEAGGSAALPTTPTARARYASSPLTLADALTARIAGGVSFSYTSGVPVNIVIRITAAQVERDYVSSYKKTTGVVAVGNADVLVSVNDNNPSAYTVFAEFTLSKYAPPAGRVWGYDDGTSSNRVLLYFPTDSSRLQVVVTTGGVEQARIDLGTVVAGGTYKVAAAIAPNDFAAVLNGGTVQTDTAGTVPPCTQFGYGHQPSAPNSQLGGPIKRIRRWSVRKTNSELQALVA